VLHDSQSSQTVSRPGASWLKVVVLLLIVEKIVQHGAVTLAFYFDWNAIRTTVAIDPTMLMVSGGIVAVLFAVALWGIGTGKSWRRGLIIGLALFDMVGEFVVQGRVDIVINVSFLVATCLLVLMLRKDPLLAMPG
jgi:hypothetical protein